MEYIKYIQDEDHYGKVIEKAASVRKSLWIGTADIKDLHVKAGNSSEPFLGVLAELLIVYPYENKHIGEPTCLLANFYF